MKTTKTLCVVGTRPEAIKMAPVILRLQGEGWADVRVLATAQHREMLDQVLDLFGIKPDRDLNIMRDNQPLGELTARLLTAADEVLAAEKPDAVLVQGDTTTVMTLALACFYRRIPVGHVEAGLRTGDLQNPFPEEANRIIAGRLSRWHFAPTESARRNLLNEGIDDGTILVTGNTVIDALLTTVAKKPRLDIRTTNRSPLEGEQAKQGQQPEVEWWGVNDLGKDQRLVLVTAHRRESFGKPFQQVCRALQELARRNPTVRFLYPVHPNPNVRAVAHQALGDLPNFTLCEPLDYAPFVAAMQRAHIILTDSGGVQEEAPALGKPVLVLRDKTERPEAVTEAVVKLVGCDYERIVTETQRLLDDEAAWQQMAKGISPYGDGHAAERITAALREHFTPPESPP